MRGHTGNRLEIDRVLSFSDPRRELAVSGWACFEDRTLPDELWLEYDGIRAPCLTNLPRPDVARHYDVVALGSAGFLARFPVVGDVTSVKVIGRRQGQGHILGEFRGTWLDPSESPASEQHGYAQWLRTHERQLFWSSSEMEERLARLAYAPLLSVIVPTYNTQLYHLERCLESVAAQHYRHWELCIADDASPDPRVRAYLQERAASDPRIRLSFGTANRGISAASNEAIASATGDFVVLLDHDDELHPHALLEVARCLNAHPDADLVYSDEDKIDQLGARRDPAFKPGFDRDLICAFNYMGHLVAIRTAVVRQVGGFRSESDGAQDWDLLLRVIAAAGRDRIQHIAKPLYHWRIHEHSTAFSLDAKPYAIGAWNGVLTRHFASRELCDVREGLFLGSMRVVRPVSPTTRISIVHRACDGEHQRRALRRTRSPCQTTFFEVVMTAVYRSDAPNSSALMTIADLHSDVTIVVSCGIDSVNHHFIEELVAQAMREDCGIVGGTVVGADGRVVTAGLACLGDGTHLNPYEGMDVAEPGYMGQARVVRRVPSIGPHFFAIRTERLLDVSGLTGISEDSLGETCSALVSSAHARGLSVLHTPFAIATLRAAVRSYQPRQGALMPPELSLNPNLAAFPNLAAVLRSGIH